MRPTTFRLVTIILYFIGSLGSLNASAANISCPKANCVHLPFVSVAHPLQVADYYEFVDRMLTIHIQGHVINRSDKPYYGGFVRVSGDNGGGITISQTVPVVPGVTYPGQLNSFEFFFGPSNFPSNPKFEVFGGYFTCPTAPLCP